MSTIIVSPMVISKNKIRPSTPIRRRCLTSLQCNRINKATFQQIFHDLVDRLKDSTDSSTQLLIRLYHHKSARLYSQPDKLYLFQREIFFGLCQLHPSVTNYYPLNQENQMIITMQPIVTYRSAKATIRKLL